MTFELFATWQNFRLGQIESTNAEDKMNAAQKVTFVSRSEEKILGKYGLPAFSPFLKILSKVSFLRVIDKPFLLFSCC